MLIYLRQQHVIQVCGVRGRFLFGQGERRKLRGAALILFYRFRHKKSIKQAICAKLFCADFCLCVIFLIFIIFAIGILIFWSYNKKEVYLQEDNFMKALVIFYSMSGNTKKAAKEIAAITGADTLELYPLQKYPDKGMKKFLWGGKSAVMGDKPVLQPYIFNSEKYDTVIFGSPVWASSFAPPLRTFIDDNRDRLENKRLAAYVCFMGSSGQKALSKLKKFIGAANLEAELELSDKEEKENKIKEFCEKLNK